MLNKCLLKLRHRKQRLAILYLYAFKTFGEENSNNKNIKHKKSPTLQNNVGQKY